MQENNASQPPSQADLEAWASTYGTTYPMLSDGTGVTVSGNNGGVPTYPVIGPDMKVIHRDLYPFNCAQLSGLATD